MKNRQMQALLTAPDGLATALRVGRGRLSMQKLAAVLEEIIADDQRWLDVSKWSSSKVSKIETGQQLPSADEVDLWADATGASAQTRKRWHELRDAADSQRSVLRRRVPVVRDVAGSEANYLESVAALTRVLQQTIVPELLQIEDYTRALWAPTHSRAEIDVMVSDLRERQKVLHAPEKRFQFLIGEAALRSIRGSELIMSAQLDRLVSAASLPNVTIGIIPLSRVLHGPTFPAGFSIYDLDEVVTSDGIEDRRYTGAPSVLLRERLDAAWEDAVQDKAARRLIIDITDALEPA